MQRYFVNQINNRFRLTDGDFHHVKDVMRLKNDEQLICVYENKAYLCKINYLKDDYVLDIIEELNEDKELNKQIILYQALIKNDKFDLIIQKACELGVSHIYPLITSRCVVKINESNINNKLNRYEKIIKEACEQSRRNIRPTMMPCINIQDIEVADDTLCLIAYEKDGDYHSFANVLKNIDAYSRVAIAIGPEGGFAQAEVDALLAKGFKSVSLGKRILRAETAAIYALSVLSYVIEGQNDD